jgi:hypothetical protein
VRATAVEFAGWPFIGLPAGIAVWRVLVTRRLRDKQRADAGRCVKCNYDLRASSDRCPECGFKFSQKITEGDTTE